MSQEHIIRICHRIMPEDRATASSQNRSRTVPHDPAIGLHHKTMPLDRAGIVPELCHRIISQDCATGAYHKNMSQDRATELSQDRPQMVPKSTHLCTKCVINILVAVMVDLYTITIIIIVTSNTSSSSGSSSSSRSSSSSSCSSSSNNNKKLGAKLTQN
uniref:Uncharacterized protein n=1 Tax=Glossina brevipalpis TaxID=37001 RepID=A0A1A9WNP1_9MUSC